MTLKYKLSIFTLLAVNAFCYFILMPYIQKSVNSHTGGSDFFSIVFNMVTLGIIVVLISKTVNKTIVPEQYLFFTLLIISFVSWGVIFYNIECELCKLG